MASAGQDRTAFVKADSRIGRWNCLLIWSIETSIEMHLRWTSELTSIGQHLNTSASRIPAAQHEGSLFAVIVFFVCLFVSLRKRTAKKKATSHRKGKMQRHSRYGFYSR